MVPAELPGSDDLQHVGAFAHFWWKRRERRRQLNNTHRGVVEDRITGGIQNANLHQVPVGSDRNKQAQATVELVATSRRGIVEITDCLFV